MEKFWPHCLEVLSQELPTAQIEKWILPLNPVKFEEGVLYVQAHNPVARKWVKQTYAKRIQEIAAQWFHVPTVELVIELGKKGSFTLPTAKPSSTSEQPSTATPATQQGSQEEKKTAQQTSASGKPTLAPPLVIIDEPDPTPAPVKPESLKTAVTAVATKLTQAPTKTAQKTAYEKTNLNPRHTFENLVIGEANAFPASVAQSLVEGISKGSPILLTNPNPLCIYGGTGLGKTHIMHAIGNAVYKNNPNLKVLYIQAKAYMDDMIRAMKSNNNETISAWRAKYNSVDLLLVDDIQFFCGDKSRTHEEFFDLFNALISNDKYLILTSDTFPKELPNMPTRLTSRFGAGLTVRLEKPNLEMRKEIIFNKASSPFYKGFELEDSVAFYIAKNIRSNVRELEGALSTLFERAKFMKVKHIDIAFCQTALKDVIRPKGNLISIENIQKTVADYFKIRLADMTSKRRPANIAKARQIAMYLSKELTPYSSSDIGKEFGGRDHTTVLYAVEKIAADRVRNSELNDHLHVLEQTLKG